MIHSMLLAFQGSLKDLTLPDNPSINLVGQCNISKPFQIDPRGYRKRIAQELNVWYTDIAIIYKCI